MRDAAFRFGRFDALNARRGAQSSNIAVTLVDHKPLMMHHWGPPEFWMQRVKRALEVRELGAFHDAVLELGSVPLPVVTARIDRFIAEDGKGPYPDME